MTSSQPTQPLTDAELAQIREDYEGVDSYDSVPRLLAEVDRLRAENTAQAAKLDAAWDLHWPTTVDGRRDLVCGGQDHSGWCRWPCPDARALGLDQDGRGQTNGAA